MARKRKTRKESETRVGIGGDGGEYAVAHMLSSGDLGPAYQRKPCATCPWRKDAEIGRFPADAFRVSANTAEDQSFSMFACHELGPEVSVTCAGFILANSSHNLGARLAAMSGRLDFRKVSSGVELYESYKAMAVANGVPEDDPSLANCRADFE